MEDSKLYSTQDIENWKNKIDAYKETLTSLKMGTLNDDYLFIKKDFNGIKTQMALIEGLTETIEDKQNSQISGHEEQIKLLSTQIESLNQMNEKMNQEILRALNKLLTIEKTETPTTTAKTENTSKFISNGAQRDPIITQTTSQSMITSKQPSYKMLQSLAGKATNGQLDTNNGIPFARNENQRNVPEERHFNQQYFQSTNTHPSQIYNGLYRNTTTESTFHFKNAMNPQETPIRVYESNILPHAEIHNSIDNELKTEDLDNYGEPEKINNTVITIDKTSSVITNEPAILEDSKVVHEPAVLEDSKVVHEPAVLEDSKVVHEPSILEDSKVVHEPSILEASKVVHEPSILEASKVVHEQDNTNTSPTLKSDEFEVFEVTPKNKFETHIQIKELNKQPEVKEESTEERQKKEKNSLFFNFFRKWS
ncbi:hypothetical protein BK128_10325 [Viridibacillus sp. FSL H7-0596]|uniref:hypothetical protein n=1 Tax=Viridibacillus sp. FSL H7-0596 TaxID=1928923 RepID=UPI00096E5496|nr:hypothetical protein [Viridibacillus sp. FSL H7-0596]OMC86459.1 hypothetical protein BK128_10325 [Viridibacillus sp. FSL H7-0596]